jgi:hypothetical protein
VLNGNDSSGDQLAVLERQPGLLDVSFPNEIVTCRLGDGSALQLFCKYSAGREHDDYGYRGGVVYETAVYRDVLQPSQLSTPTFYGAYTAMATDETWLILEYVQQSVRARTSPATMILAARWSGQFHAANEARFTSAQITSLITHDAEYYMGWVRRTSRFAGDLHQCFLWLTALCERCEEWVAPLLAPPPTVIYGEYYEKNILSRAGRFIPQIRSRW